MPAGLGRTIVVTVANMLIVLIVATLFISAIFMKQAETELRNRALEEFQMRWKELSKQFKNITPEEEERLQKELWESIQVKYGLTLPFWQKVLFYAKNALLFRFDLFPAKQQYPGGGHNAGEVVLHALKNTIILFTTATIINILIAIFLGMQAAQRAGSLFDRSLSVLALISYSLPMWWVGMMILLVFGYYLGWFPLVSKELYSALASLQREGVTGINYYLSVLYIYAKYLTLPLATIVLVAFGGGAYIVRNIVVGIMREDFVMVAAAKGLPNRMILYKHVLRAASPPIVTMTSISLVNSLGGAIITETVFQWPGMGLTYWVALNNQDVGVLIANTYVTVFLFVLVIFLLDFIYMLLDPRIRVGGRR